MEDSTDVPRAPNPDASPMADEVNLYAALATLPPEQMLGVKALAELLSCSVRTIQRWAKSFQLPPPARIGNKSIWKVKHIHDWVDRLCKRAENEADAEKSRISNYQFRM